MADQAVSCTIKPAVYLNIGGAGGAGGAAGSGVCVLDVTPPLGNTVNVSCAFSAGLGQCMLGIVVL